MEKLNLLKNNLEKNLEKFEKTIKNGNFKVKNLETINLKKYFKTNCFQIKRYKKQFKNQKFENKFKNI